MNAAKSLTPMPLVATVLLVEDEVLTRLVTADHLRDQGLRVVEAKNADEALAILRSGEGVDLMMTDIRMPGPIDGVSLAQSVKQSHQLPVILVSGHYSAALPSGIADVFFSKPYDLMRVYTAIVDLLQGPQR